VRKSLSVIVSAYNEEKKIQSALESIVDILETRRWDYELLVFNDGSSDRTGAIMEQSAADNKRITIIHNPVNKGLACISRMAIKMAGKDYVTWFSGSNSIDKESMGKILDVMDKADVTVTYMVNPQIRPPLRRFLSGLYTFAMNKIFGLNLRYFTGPSVYRTSVLRSVVTVSQGHDFFGELLIRCLKKKATYQQIPFTHQNDKMRNSKAVSWRNILSVVRTTVFLIRDIYLSHRNFKVEIPIPPLAGPDSQATRCDPAKGGPPRPVGTSPVAGSLAGKGDSARAKRVPIWKR